MQLPYSQTRPYSEVSREHEFGGSEGNAIQLSIYLLVEERRPESLPYTLQVSG